MDEYVLCPTEEAVYGGEREPLCFAAKLDFWKVDADRAIRVVGLALSAGVLPRLFAFQSMLVLEEVIPVVQTVGVIHHGNRGSFNSLLRPQSEVGLRSSDALLDQVYDPGGLALGVGRFWCKDPQSKLAVFDQEDLGRRDQSGLTKRVFRQSGMSRMTAVRPGESTPDNNLAIDSLLPYVRTALKHAPILAGSVPLV